MDRASKVVCCLLVVLGWLAADLRAEEKKPPNKGQESAPSQTSQPPAPEEGSTHRFWDATNAALFAGVGGARALDYASTRDMRSRGVNEVLLSNSVVDNRPLFVSIEAAGTALSIGVSYLFHRTGHHKLERWVSIVHIGVGVGGSIRNFGLQPHQGSSAAR